MQSGWLRRSWWLLASSVLVAGAAWLIVRAFTGNSAPEVCAALTQERIAHVHVAPGVQLRCEGIAATSAGELPGGVLAHDDADALVAALNQRKASSIAVRPQEGGATGVLARMQRLEHVYGMRGVLLTPQLAVYEAAHEPVLSQREREALAYVTRALFRGAREPSVASFPPSLRRVERVEVMVMLSEHGEPRLWRSARGTSIARALLTATRVARDRWRERENAMGGPLATRLPGLDVEVSLLSEDGVLLDTQRTFVERAITKVHGIGFDHRTAWHYVLPQEVARSDAGPFTALSRKLDEQGLQLSSLRDSDGRVYRFVSIPLGQSRAPLAKRK